MDIEDFVLIRIEAVAESGLLAKFYTLDQRKCGPYTHGGEKREDFAAVASSHQNYNSKSADRSLAHVTAQWTLREHLLHSS